MSSVRTIIRDRLVDEFEARRDAQAGRVTDFDISLRWLSETEVKRASTYCVVMTDEQRSSQTMQDDEYRLTGVIILYANDSKDSRSKLDDMIEDAMDVLRLTLRALLGTIQSGAIDSVTTTEASTAEGDWTQAVIRWSGIHRRPVMA